jgi:O-antigen/teichoic acid export membrane protein
MKVKTAPAEAGHSQATLIVLLIGRALLILSSVVSIRLATQLLGASQVGVMNLILSAITLFGLLIGAFSLYFYRQLLEWHIEGRLIENVARYALFLVISAAVACVLMLVPYYGTDTAWRNVPLPWLALLLAGNLVIATLNGAVLYALNALGRRRTYVLLSNVTSWGGVGLAVASNLLASPRAEHWLFGLLAAQLVSLCMAWRPFVEAARVESGSPRVANARVEDFRFGAVLRFSWPLAVCTALYWVQRNSFAPIMASRHDMQTLGLFSVGFSVGLLIMSSFDTLFREYYSPIYYRAIAGGDDDAKVAAWNRYAEALFPAVIAMAAFVAASGSVLLRLLVSQEFHGVASVVAWGALSQALISIYSTYVLLASSFMDNRLLLVPNMAGAVVAVALLGMLVPLHPIAGTGLAINFGLLTTTVLAGRRLSKLRPHTFPLRRTSVALALAVPLAVVPWIDRSFPHTPIILGIAGLYAVGLQYRLAQRWL